MPLMYTSVNERWTTLINTMIEKKGAQEESLAMNHWVLEANFNTALNIRFDWQLMKNAEETGLHNEQWGSRVNQTSPDAALRKITTFEYHTM